MTEKNEAVREGVEKAARLMIETIIQNSDESINRARRILLLANSGGLALVVGALGGLQSPETSRLLTLWPLVAFTLGVFLSGAGPVIDGIILAGLRLPKNSDVFIMKMANFVADKVMAQLTHTPEALAKLGAQELLSPDDVKKERPQSFWALLSSGIAFAVGVVGAYFAVYW